MEGDAYQPGNATISSRGFGIGDKGRQSAGSPHGHDGSSSIFTRNDDDGVCVQFCHPLSHACSLIQAPIVA